MRLRSWQKECSERALEHYGRGHQRFLCLATPGAGKTVMAAEVARRLLAQNMIDYVICLSPSKAVSESIRSTFEKHLGRRLDGFIGSAGGSFTYQSKSVTKGFVKRLLKFSRVLVVFDEIHHCSGNERDKANSWGRDIIEYVSDKANFLLSMTGTPWRSDNTQITLAEYDSVTGEVICDYKYGLAQALRDGVCRSPTVVVTDNKHITLETGIGESKSFDGFSDLLSNSSCPYQSIVDNRLVISHMLTSANKQLSRIRSENPDAAGLVVASNVAHARKIYRYLLEELKVSAEIVTYAEEKPSQIIDTFRASRSPWIVSVGMISEGTDIPRLQVCCHLTRIKTELHFRQILGRVLRSTPTKNRDAILYMPAESSLIEYARRLRKDVPAMPPLLDFQHSDETITVNPKPAEASSILEGILGPHRTEAKKTPETNGTLQLNKMMDSRGPQRQGLEFGVYGQFYEEVISSYTFQFS